MSLANADNFDTAVNGMADKVKSAIAVTASKATDAADRMQERVGQLASHVEDQAHKLAGAVSSATATMKSTASDVVARAGQRADELTSDTGAGLQSLANNLTGSSPRNGVANAAVNAVAESVRQTGKYLEESKLSGAADDVVGLIRRHPIPAVLLAAGLGWYLARTARKG